MKALPTPIQTTELTLFGPESIGPSTPIAAELQAHFDSGGTQADGVKLVEILERAAARSLVVSKPHTKRERGSRLPIDWQPSAAEIAFGLNRGMPRARLDCEAEKFRNYWIAKSGAGAIKRDWCATWRNWIITAMERSNGLGGYGANPPGQLTLPDVRRLDRMPSWPAWVALRVASIRTVQQRSKNDGRFREIPTLPQNLIPTSTECAEIEHYLKGLCALLAQIPRTDTRWRQEMLIHIGRVLYLKPPQTSEIGIEVIAEAYLDALDDVPVWAVRDAVRRWNRGTCGLDLRGQPFDYRWRPSPAEFRRIALEVARPLSKQCADLQRLLSAKQLEEEHDEAHRARMRKKFEELLQELKLRSGG